MAQTLKRTATCGALRKADSGKSVVLNGWIHRKRDHVAFSFINLRDHYGITQVVVDDDAPAELATQLSDLKMEYCIAVEGKVRPRMSYIPPIIKNPVPPPRPV